MRNCRHTLLHAKPRMVEGEEKQCAARTQKRRVEQRTEGWVNQELSHCEQNRPLAIKP